MYVVGAQALRSFWSKRPEAEAPLRAFYAIVSEGAWESAEALAAALGAMARREGNVVEAELTACGARVRLEVNGAAGVARVAAVETI